MTRRPPIIDRVQTGVRLEKRLVKVLKAVAELRDVSLGELLESIVFNVIDGRLPFDEEGLAQVGKLMVLYGLYPAPLPTSAPAEEE